MDQKTVNSLIRNMQKGGAITKAAPWSFEGRDEQELAVRYIGLAITPEWQEILSEKNLVILKFLIDKNTAVVELYLANKPPFLRLTKMNFTKADSWENILGEFRRRVKKDKSDALARKDQANNIWVKMKPLLK